MADKEVADVAKQFLLGLEEDLLHAMPTTGESPVAEAAPGEEESPAAAHRVAAEKRHDSAAILALEPSSIAEPIRQSAVSGGMSPKLVGAKRSPMKKRVDDSPGYYLEAISEFVESQRRRNASSRSCSTYWTATGRARWTQRRSSQRSGAKVRPRILIRASHRVGQEEPGAIRAGRRAGPRGVQGRGHVPAVRLCIYHRSAGQSVPGPRCESV